MNSTTAYKLLAQSTVAIMRLEGNQGRLVGTGFLVSKTHILTCNHVVQPFDPQNATVRYGIVKRRLAPGEVLDLRQAQITWILADTVVARPELDLAILTVDVSRTEHRESATAIGLLPPIPLKLSFRDPKIGDTVGWLGMAVLGDLVATPRFFQGTVVTNYVNDARYPVLGPNNTQQIQLAPGLQLVEINQLFVPGCSGGPVFSFSEERVIAYVHGFGSWPVGLTQNTIDVSGAQLITPGQTVQATIRSKAPVVAALSIAVDVRSIKAFLEEQGIIGSQGVWQKMQKTWRRFFSPRP